MSASFQLKQDGFDHQISMPNILPPDVLQPDTDIVANLKAREPERYKEVRPIHPKAIEFRPVENYDPLNKQNEPPQRHIWIKAKEKIAGDLPLHHQMLAYASDYNLLGTAIRPHREALVADDRPVFFASLDHAIWFHREYRLDDWLLYATDSPSASNARGFSRGSIFDQNGRLIASVAQEGLMRQKHRK